MTTIFVALEDGETEEFNFDSETHVITIGRRASNDVCIPDRSVSAAHARVSIDVDSLWIDDLNSTNGTCVNGQLVTRRQLNDGDEVVLGKISIRIVEEPESLAREPNHGAGTKRAYESDAGASPRARAAVSAEDTSVQAREHGPSEAPRSANATSMQEAEDRGRVSTGSASGPSGTPSSSYDRHPLDGLDNELARQPMLELDAAGETSRGAVIEIKNGKKSGQVLPIDKPVTTLGRPGIQIAAIMRKPDGYFLLHLESEDGSNRPMLNQSSIGDEPVMLHSGDELNVAGIDVEFVLS